MIMKTASLSFEVNDAYVYFSVDNLITIESVTDFTIETLEYILNEAKAFREYRESRIQEQQLKTISIENLTSESKWEEPKDIPGEAEESKKYYLPKIPEGIVWSHGGKYQPSNFEQTLIPIPTANKQNPEPNKYLKELKEKESFFGVPIHSTDNINESSIKVVTSKDINITTKTWAFEKTKQMMEHYSDENKVPVKINVVRSDKFKIEPFKEIPAFKVPTGESKSTIGKSKYYITEDNRLNIFRSSPYNVNIFTTVDEIKRLKTLSVEDLARITQEYEKKTYTNKAICLRHFLRELGAMEFPPTINKPRVETVKPEMSEKTKQLYDLFAKKKD